MDNLCKRRTKNEKKESTLSNERRSFGRCYLSYWKLLSNTSNSLLDMGGVMNKEDLDYDKLEVQVTVTYKGKKWDDFDVSDESLYSIYEDIDQYLEDTNG